MLYTVLYPPPSPSMPGRMGVDLLIDPIRLGWYRSLRILGHVISFISKIQAKTGKVRNIRSRFCSETDLEKVFFLYESRVIRQTLKFEQIRKFECIDEILYYRSRFMDKPSSSLLILISSHFLMFMKLLEISRLYYLILLSSLRIYNDDTSL